MCGIFESTTLTLFPSLTRKYQKMSKRRKGGGGRQVRHARPIDKQLKVVAQTLSSAAQTATTLFTVTFPCTIVGLRWDVSIQGLITASDHLNRWAIVVVRDGNSANTMSASNAADFYTPEQDVLAFGVGWTIDRDIGSGPSSITTSGSTKTMRKLMAGDTVQMIGLCSAVAGSHMDAIIQFFCKT